MRSAVSCLSCRGEGNRDDRNAIADGIDGETIGSLAPDGALAGARAPRSMSGASPCRSMSGSRAGLEDFPDLGVYAGLRIKRQSQLAWTRTSPRQASDGRRPIHDLCSLEDRAEGHERLAAVGSEVECGRDGNEIQGGENKFRCSAA